jgi:protocatechuate 3,4-dioxygenase beta subunit
MYVLKLALGDAPTYSISGRVTDANGHGISGVTVWAGFPRNTRTDANGNYTFTGLPAGTYTIRPEKAPYAFSPPSRTVTVPPDTTGQDFQAVAITKIQVNQVLGNTTNYVAGKNTAVRVFLSAAVPFDPDHQQLQIYRDGNLITQTPLKPRKFSGQSDVLDFLCDRQECDGWKKGFYTFEARVNGDYLSQPRVEFKERRKLRILVRPVTVVDVTGIHTPNPDLSSYADFLKRVYPLAADAVDWQIGIPYVYNALLFPPLNSETGRKLLWFNLTFSYWLPGYHDVVLGVLPPTDLGGLQGYTLGPPTSIVMEGDSLQADIAHEIGHNVGVRNPLFPGRHEGLGDEYNSPCAAFQCDNNPPPKVYRGLDGRTLGGCRSPANFSCLASQAELWKPGSGCGSKVLGTTDSPFDVVTGQVLGDRLSFMGCSTGNQNDYWITPAAYKYLFDNLAPSLLSASATLATERVARVTGWIGQDGTVSLDPVYHLLAEHPPTDSGSYSIQVLAPSGQVVASQAFDVSFLALTNPPTTLTRAPFHLMIALPNGASRIQVLLGTTVLAETTVSAHAPVLSLTSPTSGQNWSATGSYTIRWQGSDLDGDTLHYTVLYRQGAGNWDVLGGDLTGSGLTVNAADLPGGNAAQVQVLATDGINTTTAESGLFTVGRKGPKAFITYPAEGASFMPGVSFFLQGTAYDLEDGTLPDSAYRWTSNKDGDLGTGASNLVILSPGPHVITLTVTDSDGNSAVKTIRLSAGSQQFMPLILRSR